MKIQPSVTSLQGGKSETTGTAERSAIKPSAEPRAPASSDTIHLSALSSQLQALEASLGSGGEFDRTKVEAIKSAIREGRLTVNAEVVADKMLSHALDMITKES